MPSDFDVTGWQLKHTDLLNNIRDGLEAEGKTVFTENQNSLYYLALSQGQLFLDQLTPLDRSL